MPLTKQQENRLEEIANDVIRILDTEFRDISMSDFAEAVQVVRELLQDREQCARDEARRR